MAIETDITKLVFNKMSQEKYEELKANGELVNNEFYITPDSNIDIDIDIPENVVEADNYVNAKLWKGTLAEYKALESYDDSVTYIITDDVVEGETIIDLTDYVKNTDYATTSKAGVIKAYTQNGFGINNSGQPFSQTVTLASYKGYGGNFFIGKGTLENIKYDFVKDGVVNNNISLSEANKEKARNWIGASAEVIQQSSLSDLPADRNVDKVYQYTGETTEEFVNGYFYKSVAGESKYVSADPRNITFDYDLFWSELENAGITLETLRLTEEGKTRGGFSIIGTSVSETEYRVTDINGVAIDVLLTKSVQSSQNIIGTSTRWYYTYTTIYEWKPIEVQSDNSSLKKLDTTQITNCITEIPQDIKLELVDGTLTLKAGSKLYVPNGFEEDGVTKKFDEYIVQADRKYVSPITTEATLIMFITGSDGFTGISQNVVVSGSVLPSTGVNYNTDTNIISFYRNDVVEWTNGTFPIAIIKISSDGVISSIDQVFNGFGYIGSTVFALPGVKGLIPNGRNDDGSLKNIETINDKVLIYTNLHPRNNAILGFSNLYVSPQNILTYNELENINLSGGINPAQLVNVATWSADSNNVITSFTPKLPFHAVDYNDSSWISAQAMPSGKYIDLTLGATGTSYTAPANGWFVVRKRTAAANQGLFFGISNGVQFEIYNPVSGAIIGLSVPAKKGDVLNTSYSAGGTTEMFRFIYAQGEK